MTTRQTCPHCGQPLETIIQPALLPTQKPIELVTCWNTICKLYGFTQTAEALHEMECKERRGHER